MIQKTISYNYSPYTYARISAMKSLLLKREDYTKLGKMTPSEIAFFLQENMYKNEFNKLGVKYKGTKLVEHSLNLHLTNIFQKIRTICNSDIRYLVDLYLRRYDYYNIKVILRAKISRVKDYDTLLIPAGSLDIKKLRKIASHENVREILNSSGILRIENYDAEIKHFRQTGSIGKIEDRLDYDYLKESLSQARKIPNKGKQFRDFFKYDADAYNLKLLLKKMFYNLSKEDVDKFILPSGKYLNRETIDELLNVHDYSLFKKVMESSVYDDILPKHESNDILLRLEVAFDRYLYKKSLRLFHQNPMSVDLILGYMFAKEVEVKNIRAIVKSRQFEETADYVKNMIIT